MIPYFFILFSCVALSKFKVSSQSKYGILLPRFWLVIVLLCMFAGIRATSVGTDTGNYAYTFKKLEYLFKDGFVSTGSMEVGYLLLQFLLLKITNEYWVLLTAIAVLSIYFPIRVIYKYSTNIKWSIFIFITLGYYLFFFNGARQGIAASFVTYAFSFAFEKNIKKFLTFVLLGALFHKTALLSIPFYFIIHMNFSLRNLIGLITVSIIAVSYLSEIVAIYDVDTATKYIQYVDRGARGGFLISSFFFINTLILIFQRNFINPQNLIFYDKLLNIATIHTVIYLAVLITGKDINLIRLSIYFYIAFPLIWPLIFNDSKFFKSVPVQVFYAIVNMIFFYVYIDQMSNLNPYQLNPNLF